MRLRALFVLISSLVFGSISSSQEPETGSYALTFEGELSGQEFGAARFASDKKMDGEKVFVVHLLTPVLEGGVYVVFSGVERPAAGTYTAIRAETKGMGGYKKLSVEPGEVALLYYEMERDRLVLFGSTGKGSVEIIESDDDTVTGRIDVEIEGAIGNPNAFLGVRAKRGKIAGAFDATNGEVEFRKP